VEYNSTVAHLKLCMFSNNIEEKRSLDAAKYTKKKLRRTGKRLHKHNSMIANTKCKHKILIITAKENAG